MKKRILSVALTVTIIVCLVLFNDLIHARFENDTLRSENEELKRNYVVETEELVPCYLCGGNAKIKPVNESFYIECEDCDLTTDFFKSKADLIRYWNKD